MADPGTHLTQHGQPVRLRQLIPQQARPTRGLERARGDPAALEDKRDAPQHRQHRHDQADREPAAGDGGCDLAGRSAQQMQRPAFGRDTVWTPVERDRDIALRCAIEGQWADRRHSVPAQVLATVAQAREQLFGRAETPFGFARDQYDAVAVGDEDRLARIPPSGFGPVEFHLERDHAER